MKRVSLIFLLVGILIFSVAGVSSAALTVTPETDPDNLVNAILGPGVTVVPGSPAFAGGTGDNASAGTFTEPAGRERGNRYTLGHYPLQRQGRGRHRAQ